ncbi:GTPase-activating protein GYP2 [Heracleum sosnowskyi]|uniref:GTPase-activating protein GYP2 n=1 Tax=Heracleum sosnowskyi TaxID=360622 RepID=A0AAD8IYD6_9APIA|nr:GTPase-activating protein GYP2 [Heracleum sosnowskyi]
MLLSLLSKRSLDVDSRDSYGFNLRPQHLQRYQEYSIIYKKEEEERADKWKRFLEQAQSRADCENEKTSSHAEPTEKNLGPFLDVTQGGEDLNEEKSVFDVQREDDANKEEPTKKNKSPVQKWAQEFDEDTEEVFHDTLVNDGICTPETEHDVISPESFAIWNKELEVLVQGGVPRNIRGEVWQAFVGARKRRADSYYQNLLDKEIEAGQEQNKSQSSEKLRKQIEKDLPRTFPGHPALDEGGRNSLRRVLIAYSRHNPRVGYCQGMNFFAGLLLLMMPEENAFWTFVGIIDDYFDGYFSQEMIESQVDQLVFEDLMREIFPKLVSHLDYLGVQVGWISGPWFLSIFVNMIPWESVLRVWDVLLFEGNRVMLFRTALALMEFYGPALIATNDTADAITLLQTLVGSTFDSSQLVLTACMGYWTVTEDRLQQLRNKHRPSVVDVMEERSKGALVRQESKILASKLYSFKHAPESLALETIREEESNDHKETDGQSSTLESQQSNMDEFVPCLGIDSELDAISDIQDQVIWLKAERCRLLEEKRSATLRTEELETAFMEIVQQDNRRELTARVEQLEKEVVELRHALDEKNEQENMMREVLLRVEEEQKLAQEARISAEQDASAQRYAAHVIQEKYEKAMTSVATMEKRVVTAESMLEATLQYESDQVKAQSSPRCVQPVSQELQTKRSSLLSFGLSWRDNTKGSN